MRLVDGSGYTLSHVPGMSVLDIGSGVGDVALISAQLDAIAGRHILIHLPDPAVMIRAAIRFLQIGRASCRERV